VELLTAHSDDFFEQLWAEVHKLQSSHEHRHSQLLDSHEKLKQDLEWMSIMSEEPTIKQAAGNGAVLTSEATGVSSVEWPQKLSARKGVRMAEDDMTDCSPSGISAQNLHEDVQDLRLDLVAKVNELKHDMVEMQLTTGVAGDVQLFAIVQGLAQRLTSVEEAVAKGAAISPSVSTSPPAKEAVAKGAASSPSVSTSPPATTSPTLPSETTSQAISTAKRKSVLDTLAAEPDQTF
jgi:hypothetical protein